MRWIGLRPRNTRLILDQSFLTRLGSAVSELLVILIGALMIQTINLIDLVHDRSILFSRLPSRHLGVTINGFVPCSINLPVGALLPLSLSA
jgi:hypothetical protein